MDVCEDLVVVGPGGTGEVDRGIVVGLGVELLEEESTKMNSTSTRDGLEGGDLVESVLVRCDSNGGVFRLLQGHRLLFKYGSQLTLFSLIAGLSSPRTSFWEALVNCCRPAMGRYSWSRSGSLRRTASA